MNRFAVLLLLFLFFLPLQPAQAPETTEPETAIAFTFATPEDPQPRIVLDEGGSDLLLSAIAPVTQVQVLALEYHYDDETEQEYFTVASTLYESDSWHAGDGVILRSYLPDTIPNLYIRCLRTDGTEEAHFLADSGRDGSLLLLSLEIPIAER